MSVCTIVLENMEFKAYHGCYDLEKVVGNRFQVSMRVRAEIGDAARTDEIAQTVSYLTLYEVVAAQMARTSNLLENVAQRIVDAVRTGFPAVTGVEVTVSKLAPPLGGKIERVSVTMEG